MRNGFFIGASAVIMMLVVAGCSSSQPTEEQAFTEPDSTLVTPPEPAPQSLPIAPKKANSTTKSTERKSTGFVAQDDTIEAEVVARTRVKNQPPAGSVRAPKEKFYSVQLGAFKIASNAERCQRLIKERYKKTVYHFYDKSIKMYRVAVGHFSSEKDASAFLRQIKEKYPKDYRDAWVGEMKQ